LAVVITGSISEIVASIRCESPFVEAGVFVSIDMILSFDWFIDYPPLLPIMKLLVIVTISIKEVAKVE